MATSTYNLIRQAILEKKQIHATYQGHSRKMCPHVIGTKNGCEQALFFQFAGGSSRGLPPGGAWRCIQINGLTDVSIHEGDWRTGDRQPDGPSQSCVGDIDVEVPY